MAPWVPRRQMTCVALLVEQPAQGFRGGTDAFLVFTCLGVLRFPSYSEMCVWRGINTELVVGCVEIRTSPSWPAALDPEQKRMFASISSGRRELNAVYQEEGASWFKIE